MGGEGQKPESQHGGRRNLCTRRYCQLVTDEDSLFYMLSFGQGWGERIYICVYFCIKKQGICKKLISDYVWREKGVEGGMRFLNVCLFVSF